jgi:mono/diheme cytochrome c family protein
MSGRTLGTLMAGATLVCVFAASWSFGSSPGAIQGAAKSQTAKQEDERLIESIQGPALYQAYCASCHGKDAKGGGLMAKSLKVPPADLTRISARNAGKFPLMRVERIISGEEQTGSGHGTREMPVWGSIFSQVSRDQDLGRVRIDNLARYLRDIQTK